MNQKIVLADDHQLLIEGVKIIIKEIENVEIIAEANNSSDLLHFLSTSSADLVILDLNIPGKDGLKCLSIIKQRYPQIKVLILTSYNQPELVKEVKLMKADGFIVKNSSSSELKSAITQVLNGEKFFAKEKEQDEVSSLYFVDDFLKKYQLTKREVDIIKLVCSGMTSKEIAGNLFLSEFTVNTHRKNIFRKLNVQNIAGLMNFAKENGLE
jgi:DNA-binding NarL/FixJ family response regulator